jgi:hypothetical protein
MSTAGSTTKIKINGSLTGQAQAAGNGYYAGCSGIIVPANATVKVEAANSEGEVIFYVMGL